MTLAEILSNEELRHHEFPVTRQKVFLAHAAVCAIPRRVSEAIRDYATQCTLGDQETLLPAFQIRQSREAVARLLKAQPEEIAFVGPTTLALNFVARGLNLRRGDNIVVYFDDYPSNVYPWMALAEKGVEVRLLNIRDYGCIRNVEVMGQVDENTKLVALASCHFVTGHRLDLRALGDFLRKRKVLFCVDGIQTVGAFPTPLDKVDFLAADAHKWLLGPCAAGIFYVSQAAQEKLKPSVLGWNNVRCPDFVAQEQMVLQPDARRYEAGSDNLLGLVGLRACVELILEIGVENIAAELLRKRAWLVPALQEKGYTVLCADNPPQHASGIVSFYREGQGEGQSLAGLHKKLEENQIITSLRTDRKGRQYLRLSPHFYNTDAELHRLLDQV